MDIFELISQHGAGIADEKAESFNRQFRQTWKHVSELSAKAAELAEARAKVRTLEEALETARLSAEGEKAGARAELETQLGAERETLEKTLKMREKEALLRLLLRDVAHDPDDVIRLLDLSALSVEDGVPAPPLSELIRPLKKEKAYLFKAEGPTIRGARPGEPGDTKKRRGSALADQLNSIFGIKGV